MVAGGVVADLSDPSTPVVTSFDAFVSADDVALEGDVAWWTRRGSLCATDLSDPAAPVLLGCHELADAWLSEISVDGGRLVGSKTVSAPEGWRHSLVVFDVSEPTAPVEVGSLELPAAATELVVRDHTAAFQLGYHPGARPRAPKSTREAHALGVGYVGEIRLGLADLSDPASPRLVGLRPVHTNDLVLADGLLGATSPGTVSVLDSGCDTEVVPVTISLDPRWPLLGEEVDLTARAFGEPADFAWSFSDGGTASGPIVSRTFDGLAPVEVTVEATGDWGSGVLRRMVGTTALASPGWNWTVVPAAAHTYGVGTTWWRSDLLLVNSEQLEQEVALYFAPRGGSNLLASGSRLVLPPGGTLLADVVAGMPATGSGVGALFLRVGLPGTVAATSRTFTEDGEGTYGQHVPVLPTHGTAHGVGDLLLLREDEAFRSNLGLVNLTGQPAGVTIELYDAGRVHALLGTVERTVPPYGYLQENRVLRTVASQPLAKARARVIAPHEEVVAWASVVDNLSGDAVFVTHAPVAAPTLWIPAVAHTSGLAREASSGEARSSCAPRRPPARAWSSSSSAGTLRRSPRSSTSPPAPASARTTWSPSSSPPRASGRCGSGSSAGAR